MKSQLIILISILIGTFIALGYNNKIVIGPEGDVSGYIHDYDVITLERGNYYITCTEISNDLVIEGAGSERTIIESLCPEVTFRVKKGRLLMKGVTLLGEGSAAFEVSGSSEVELLDVRIVNFRTGVRLKGVARVVGNNLVIGSFMESGIEALENSQLILGNAMIYSGEGLADKNIGILIKDNAKAELTNLVIRDLKGNGILGKGDSTLKLVNVIIEKTMACAVRSEDRAKIIGRAFLRENNYDLCGNVDPEVRVARVPQTIKEVIRIPEDYSDLQEAIDAVRPGGSVIVIGGRYPSITIWKNVNIVGYRSPIIGGVSVLRGVKASLEGINIEGNKYAGVVNYGDLRLINVILTRNGKGIEAREASSTELFNVKVINNYQEGILARENSTLFIKGTSIKRNNMGLEINDKVALMIFNSSISENYYRGLEVLGNPFIYLFSTVITSHSGDGVFSSSSPLIFLQNSKIAKNINGISLEGGSSLVAYNSSLIGNEVCDIELKSENVELSLINSSVGRICSRK